MFIHKLTHQSLDIDECRRLLGSELLGRVALSIGALPTVVPVLYRLVSDQVVFAVEADSLYAVLSDNIVAFEVDHVDIETNQGWTVVVVGRSRPVYDLSLVSSPLAGTDGSSPPDRLIGIGIDRLSGLRTVDLVGRPEPRGATVRLGCIPPMWTEVSAEVPTGVSAQASQPPA